MGYYLLQAAYTRETWVTMKATPEPGICVRMIKPVVEQIGGRYENGWLAFGEYDSVVIFEIPDNVSAAAVSVALTTGGAFKSVKTTPLMTIDEGRAALRRAAAGG
jgi:uncharacterized protein with GYD domain